MGRRRAKATNNSLDLLLDTVSNVFGGLIFLTLLAALLVISRSGTAIQGSQKPSAPSAIPSQNLSVEYAAREIELSELDFLLESQSRALATMVPSGNVEREISILDGLQKTTRSIESQITQAQEDIRSLMEILNQKELSQLQLEHKKAGLQQQLETKQSNLRETESKSSRKVTFSFLRPTQTREIVVLLRYGKVYQLTNSADPEDIRDEDIKESGIFQNTYEPRKERGSRVTPEALQKLMRFIGSYSPGEYNIVIAVWNDSFAEFNLLRNELIKQHYSYRTIICTDESSLSFGSGVNRLVQ